MTLQESEKYLIFKALSGSHAYGLNIEGSDEDYRGVFLLPNDRMLKIGMKCNQTDDAKHDITYYELNRFFELLISQNPNIIELLFMPQENIEICTSEFQLIRDVKERLLTKTCKDTFCGYAIAQIKKARGLSKKIVNPVDKEKKTPLDFCYVPLFSGQTISLNVWLKKSEFNQEDCGLSILPHIKDGYSLFHEFQNPYNFRGIVFDDSNAVHLSSIPKGRTPKCHIFYNFDGYSKYCKDYKEYWDWVENRNPIRYQTNMKHGKGYDGKNLMHCLRLLDMGIEILETGIVNVRRPDREFLLSVRNGDAEYDDIVALAEEKIEYLDKAKMKSTLPGSVNVALINELITKIRKL